MAEWRFRARVAPSDREKVREIVASTGYFSAAEIDVAQRALAAIPGGAPLYARVDLLPSPTGPQLLELELTEPSLFFADAPGATERFVAAIEQAFGQAIVPA